MNMAVELIPNRSRGRFIALVGVSGSGKTTLSAPIRDYLQNQGIESIYLKNPSNDFSHYPPFRRYLDEIETIARGELDLPSLTIMSLGDILLTLRTKITPALSTGKWVICDRYLVEAISGLEVGGGSPYDFDKVKELTRLFLQPDMAIVIAIQPESAIQRILSRKRQGETKADDFGEQHFNLTNDSYCKFAMQNNWMIVDGSLSQEELFELIRPGLDSLVKGSRT